MYELSYVSLLNLPDVHLNNFLFGTLLLDLKSTSPTVINNFFSDFLYTNFPDFITMYIVQSPLSLLAISFTFLRFICLSPVITTFSSFTAECYAIVEALTLISSFPLNKFLIISESDVMFSISNFQSLQL